MNWKLIDNGPQFWLFFHDGKNYFLTVRCQQSFVEYEILLQISPEEYREYHARGHVYLDYLAARVSYWASEYKKRNVTVKYRDETQRAVDEWKAAHPDESL